MLQQLYSIQEIGILLLQISGFLFALLAIWILVMAGTELYRDRKCQMDKNKRRKKRG